MPNKGHIWTADEEKAVLEMDWETFNNAYNGAAGLDISYDAYRIRKALLQRSDRKVKEAEPVEIPGASSGDYISLSLGYYDIETTFSTQPRMLYGCIADAFGNVEHFSLLDEEYKGRDWLDDSVLVDKYARRLEEYDVLVGWNSKRFDQPVISGRLNYWRVMRDRGFDVRPDLLLRPLEPKTHIDLMWYASGQFNRIGRRSLESVSTFFNSPNRKTPLDVRTWDKADHGDEDAYRLIGDHCAADVLVLRDVFAALKPQVRNIHR